MQHLCCSLWYENSTLYCENSILYLASNRIILFYDYWETGSICKVSLNLHFVKQFAGFSVVSVFTSWFIPPSYHLSHKVTENINMFAFPYIKVFWIYLIQLCTQDAHNSAHLPNLWIKKSRFQQKNVQMITISCVNNMWKW